MIEALALSTIASVALFLWTIATLWLAESISRRGVKLPLATRAKAIKFGIVYSAGLGVAAILSNRLFQAIGIAPVLTIEGPVGALFGFLVGDFCYYWMHRAEHAVPFLWRYHRVHHSIETMGAGTGFQHIIQIAVEVVCLSLPLALFATEDYAWIGIGLNMLGYYLHSTVGIHVGGSWIVNNHTHRVHHSRDPRHFNRNFGVPTLIWDRLFGTAYFPGRDEWPEVGLADMPEPANLREWLFPDAKSKPQLEGQIAPQKCAGER